MPSEERNGTMGAAGGGAGACPGGTPQPDADRVDVEILETLGEMMGSLLKEAERLAQRFGLPAFSLKALHLLDCPLAMKDLGRRMHCDPSFVTGIADMLEKRGLATRESDPADRRVKRLALTPAGQELRERLEREFLAIMPWRRALGADERACLLSHLSKIVPAVTGQAGRLMATHGSPPSSPQPKGVSETLVTAPATGADS